jgi:hypothetical protein
MNTFLSKATLAIVVAMSFLLGGQWASAASLPGWGGATTTTQPQPIQQPRQPLVSQPSTNTAQTVQAPQSGTWTTPGTTSGTPTNSTVSTPVQQRVSQPKVGEAEVTMSIAQDECALFLKYLHPDPYAAYAAQMAGNSGGSFAADSVANFFGGSQNSSSASSMNDDWAYIKEFIVLEKGDYQVMYLSDLLLIMNINSNNSVEFLVRLPGVNRINGVHIGADDWTKGKKSRITLRPGENVQFDNGSATTLIKVRCP